ncbi:hypothetical protein QYE76_070065 [Lolium multiflorum]|uniref:Radical SAM core domain-containing protein n=1 Tax=Lolium multiflorum TaxID=4521 RepID=A0AAD8SJX0_LOLMU|nr:hypothetical protein QYE76_070065 [Lolium multiflorum]
MASSSSKQPSHRSVFDAGYIRAEFEAAGVSPHFIPLIWKYVLQNPRCADLDGVPSLPAAAYALLRTKFRPTTSTLSAAAESKDRTTTKLLIRLQNGESVEAVIMRYDSRLGKYDGKTRPGGVRSTLCVSSQVGCKMGCRFCATGTMGFKSNLTSGEIVEQMVHASRYSQIRNIVFMGMGEPLNNYTALVEAIQVLTASPFQISPKRVTVSTVGIIHSINKFNNDLPNINLAVSLHAPDQDIRCHIMPAARAFPLAKLMNALQSYQNVSKQTIFIEYIMLDGVNDQEEHAHQLCKLLETFKVVVNLIPFNPIGSSSNFKTSSEQNVKKFQKVLRGVYGIRTTVRQEMGQDIAGACGQLVVSLPDERSAGGATLLSDIEDLRL